MENNFLRRVFFGIDNSWKDFFEQEKSKPYFTQLLEKLKEEYLTKRCWPNEVNIFRIFKIASLHNAKVIILGQDPYHSPFVADGLAFSTSKFNYIPASLKNIFIELQRDLGYFFTPKNGDLSCWVSQGVLLLNTALTVINGMPMSHHNLWQEFTFSLMSYIKNKNPSLIWVFWGDKAKKIKEILQIKDDSSIISAHPSPFSVNKGFFNSKPFSRINDLLKKQKKSIINWTLN